MATVRALVIGAGETSALMHLPVLAGLRDRGRLRLVEICDVRMQRADAARQRFGFLRVGGDGLAAVGRPDIDAVYLFGDARLHRDYGAAALEAGKHLFVEKPIAPSHADACALAAAAAKRGLIAVGGHNRRFYRSLEEVRRRGGKAGWRSAEAVFHKPATRSPPPFGATSWLTANGIHALDALVFLMGGLPEQLTSLADGERFSALMQWADGAQGVFLCDNQAGARRETYAFHAPGLSCTAGDEGLRIQSGGSETILDLPAIGDGVDAEHAAFLDGIADGSEPRHSLAALAPSLRLAELIEQGFSGRIDWPGLRPSPALLRARPPRAGALLIVNGGGLATALASHPGHRSLVALEDVARSGQARPDIVAALIGTGPETLGDDILDRLPNLSVAGLAGLSFARHRPEQLLERGITLVNASRTYAESLAELALGLAILARRRAFSSDRIMRQGGWGTTPRPMGLGGAVRRAAGAVRPALAAIRMEQALLKLWRRAALASGLGSAPAASPQQLQGSRVGLVGWGGSARALARRLLASGAQVLVFSEHATPDEIVLSGGAAAPLAEVLASDIVSLHRGLTPTTRHFLGAAELARLRPGSILINLARGALVEPDALLQRLRRGDVFACLDTFEQEPPPASDPLRRLPNVFLTSHIAGGSADMQAAAAREVLEKVARHLDGEPSPAVGRERLRTMT